MVKPAFWGLGATVAIICFGSACRSPGRDFGKGQSGGGSSGGVTAGGGGAATGGSAVVGGALPTAGVGGESAMGGDGGGDGSDISCAPDQPLCVGNQTAICNSVGDGYTAEAVSCSATQICVAGACEERECAPGERFCSGSAVRECASDGLSSAELEACATDHYCDTATAQCLPGTCSPNAPSCDGNRATTCNAEGSGYAAGGTLCTASQACEGGQCIARVCEPNATFCQGQSVKSCSANGLSSTVESVCTGQTCVESAGGASCAGICEPTQVQCASGSQPQKCGPSGTWVDAAACAANRTCVNGACTGMCGPTQKRCSGNGVQACDTSGVWSSNVTACGSTTPHCASGVCGAPPSCAGLANDCDGNASCCSSSILPKGTYNRSNDPSYPATVSRFRLDNYEVTVGRFRKFVAAYSQNMISAGAGKNPNNPSDPGWSTSWNELLPANATELKESLAVEGATWTAAAGANENLPMNYIHWYLANAFCTWDGGRMPTEAEWNYAAAGGNEQRLYPWGNQAPSELRAVYDCNYDDPNCNVAPVGSVSTGTGLWGQLDLAGNVSEWTLDGAKTPYADGGVCVDCANLTDVDFRHFRGGDYNDPTTELLNSRRNGYTPTESRIERGVRCARAP